MATKPLTTITLPKAPDIMSESNTKYWMNDIVRVLSIIISLIQRPSIIIYTLATLPNAGTTNKAQIVMVSDAVVGQQFKGSDGTAWRNLG